MSTTITPASVTTPDAVRRRAPHPSFFGLLRGEFLKIGRQWMTWIMAVLLACFIGGIYLISLSVSGLKDQIAHEPLTFLYREMSSGLDVLRVFGGIFIIVLTARIFGLEYQYGTIRILISRGVGRLQLFFVKLLAITLIALLVLVIGSLLVLLLTGALALLTIGNLDVFGKATAAFWSDIRLTDLTIAISMGVSILMATAFGAVGRSQVFGLSAALGFFPIDNFAMLFMYLGQRLTHSDFWIHFSTYFLGPNLNVMAGVVASSNIATIGISPLEKVDATHTLLVTLGYAIVFAAVAIILTWRRDVKE